MSNILFTRLKMKFLSQPSRLFLHVKKLIFLDSLIFSFLKFGLKDRSTSNWARFEKSPYEVESALFIKKRRFLINREFQVFQAKVGKKIKRRKLLENFTLHLENFLFKACEGLVKWVFFQFLWDYNIIFLLKTVKFAKFYQTPVHELFRKR